MKVSKKIGIVMIAAVMLLSTAIGAFATGSGDAKPYIAVVSKGEQHDFWQQVKLGAQDAAEKYGVDITFEGPASESDVQDQVEMLNNAMAKNPVAIALAVLIVLSLIFGPVPAVTAVALLAGEAPPWKESHQRLAQRLTQELTLALQSVRQRAITAEMLDLAAGAGMLGAQG